MVYQKGYGPSGKGNVLRYHGREPKNLRIFLRKTQKTTRGYKKNPPKRWAARIKHNKDMEKIIIRQLLVQEDDCAPDALEYFEKELIKLTGANVKTFREASTKNLNEFGDEVSYMWLNFELTSSADDPYWKLYEHIETTSARI